MPDQEQQQDREQEESLARIEQGGIPISAERRLTGLRDAQRQGEAASGGAFTSDLSVDGFALCHRLGLRPLSQVMGSSIYQLGYQGAWGAGYGENILIEMDTLSEALNEVRGRALARLGEEARHVGADAVVGVQTRAGESQLDTGTLALEHVVMGTAVRRDGARTAQPVLTELSVAEYAMLLQGGFEPLGIVAWSAVFFTAYTFGGMATGGMLAGPLTMGVRNFELREFTQAIYTAREAVMGQLTAQASQLGASGIVGMKIGHTVRPHTLSGGTSMGLGGGMAGGRELRGMMVTFTAVGTAIQQQGDATIATPKTAIDLTS
ncbi:MAG TPA: heavy metal-binding domain-containing protein [Solirubrobacteraceae bacterium]|jgi:uncharacterized protein YbjQ (UPF0145 family)|nr:heavy metal-binding domain-containing protein [Solirubrobacteraceae bacterium]